MTDSSRHINDIEQPLGAEKNRVEHSQLSSRQIGGLVLASLALFGTLGTGCSAKSPEQTPTTTTTESTVTAQNSSTSPEQGVESYNTQMEKYRDMSVSEFHSLSREEQMAYAQFLTDRTVSRNGYEVRYGDGTSHHQYMITPVASSLDNSGQEIVNNNLYQQQIAFIQLGNGEYDEPDAEKALSAVYYQLDESKLASDAYRGFLEEMRSSDKPLTMVNSFKVTKTSDLMSGTDTNDEAVKYKIITSIDETNSKTIYTRYIYREFTSYDGSTKAFWVNDFNAYSLNQLKVYSSLK